MPTISKIFEFVIFLLKTTFLVQHDDRRRMRKSEPMGGKSEGPGRRWGSRVSLGVDDKTSSFDLDDADDLDTWSDTTEVIYPPSDSESVDTYAR